MITQMCLIPWYGERDLAGQRLALHSIPMYHAMGALQTMWTVRILYLQKDIYSYHLIIDHTGKLWSNYYLF